MKRFWRIVKRHRRLIRVVALVIVVWEATVIAQIVRLRWYAPESTSIMRIRESASRTRGRPFERSYYFVPMSRIDKDLQRAVVVSEDARFFDHWGFDLHQIQDAIGDSVSEGEFPRGASTITQQLAKNLFLSDSKNPLRKVREAILTVYLELALSKRRILEIYLNVIEWGHGVFGAEAASRYHFGDSASSLSTSQAALLAAIIPGPTGVFDPKKHPRRVAVRQSRIERTLLGR